MDLNTLQSHFQNLLFLQQSLCWNEFKEKEVRGLEKDAENKGERILWTLETPFVEMHVKFGSDKLVMLLVAEEKTWGWRGSKEEGFWLSFIHQISFYKHIEMWWGAY
jgi:hypothetical protein